MIPKVEATVLARGAVLGYCHGNNWLYAVVGETSHAYALWGVPEEADARALLSFFDASYGQMKAHAILADLSELEFVHPSSFLAYREYFEVHATELSAMVTDACVLLRDSLAGSIAAGFFGIVPAPFPVSTCRELGTACERLGFDSDARQRFEYTKETVFGKERLLTQVRLAVATQLIDPDIEVVARTIGVSPRTLQRRLTQAGTSFSDQVVAARIDCAKGLLTTSTHSITRIALDVGFKTLEHFSSTFRDRVGVSPSTYRKG